MKLTTKTVDKVWGKRSLPPPFVNPGIEPVGEIWFEPAPELPQILVKYLFTSEKLSVQVHPTDAQAPQGQRGKEECWLVLDAEPGATLAIGFKEDIDAATMRAAALDGSIEDALQWHAVRAGDFLYLPAGTVHAIGPGLTLIEVQQNSDITYRLYDYGRPRELHLDAGVAVASGHPYPARCRVHVDPESSVVLVEGPHFRLSHVAAELPKDVRANHPGIVQVLPVEGTVAIGSETIAVGESGLANALSEIDFSAARRTLLVSAA